MEHGVPDMRPMRGKTEIQAAIFITGERSATHNLLSSAAVFPFNKTFSTTNEIGPVTDEDFPASPEISFAVDEVLSTRDEIVITAEKTFLPAATLLPAAGKTCSAGKIVFFSSEKISPCGDKASSLGERVSFPTYKPSSSVEGLFRPVDQSCSVTGQCSFGAEEVSSGRDQVLFLSNIRFLTRHSKEISCPQNVFVFC